MKATRFELIDSTGRVIVHRSATAFDVELCEQDGGRTCKVRVGATLSDEDCQRLLRETFERGRVAGYEQRQAEETFG